MNGRRLGAVALGSMLVGAVATASLAQIGKPISITGPLKIDSARIQALRATVPALNPPIGLTRAQYIERLRKAFVKRDVNKDKLVSWQNGGSGETLPAFQKCVVVIYKSSPASTTKDPAHPGQFIVSPASTVPVDWEYFLDRLGKTSMQGSACEKAKTETESQCVIDGKTFGSTVMAQWALADSISKPGYCAYPQFKKTSACAAKSSKALCEDRNGQYSQVETQVCEKLTTDGPDSAAALAKVAGASFDAEDWNKNGQIDGGEGEFLCPAA